MYSSAAHRTRDRQARAERDRDRGRVLQLGLCLILFLTVFLGKGVFPSRVQESSQRLLELLGADTDFKGAFVRLGDSLSGREDVLWELQDFCLQVFGETKLTEARAPALPDQLRQESDFLSQCPQAEAWTEHYFRYRPSPAAHTLPEEETAAPEPEEDAAPEVIEEAAPADSAPEIPEAVPAAGTVLEAIEVGEPAFPQGYTMDRLSLGALETTTPVLGPIRSGYGYRTHPINGKYSFHGGVDIGADAGVEIGAFAAGVVEYIGEDDSYGKYVQLDHGEGVKSFYAHCSKLLVQQGQRVALGETIALVGSTGSATGPHLHFEMKYAGEHLNPLYYIDSRGA